MASFNFAKADVYQSLQSANLGSELGNMIGEICFVLLELLDLHNYCFTNTKTSGETCLEEEYEIARLMRANVRKKNAPTFRILPPSTIE